jgi:glycosyltransferase involved in cell wall biosynthesis
LQVIKLLAEEDPNAQYLSFSRNFGKEAAMLAGMRHSIGDLIVIMDVELQDPPALIPQMIAAIEYHRFSKGIFGWAGYNTKWLEYQNVERVAGETKWSFWKLFKYAIEYFINRGFANDIFRNYRRVFVQNAHGS